MKTIADAYGITKMDDAGQELVWFAEQIRKNPALLGRHLKTLVAEVDPTETAIHENEITVGFEDGSHIRITVEYVGGGR
jgi:hypothetical protein